MDDSCSEDVITPECMLVEESEERLNESLTEFVSFDDGRKESGNSKWDQRATQLLLSAYDQTNEDFGKKQLYKTKKEMWVAITDKINEHGYDFTSKQTENRLYTVMRTHKRRKHAQRRPRSHLKASHTYEKFVYLSILLIISLMPGLHSH